MKLTKRARVRKEAPSYAASQVSSLDAHLGYWLRFVSNHVSHSFRAKLERQGVTVAEWVVLRALLGEERVKPSVLASKIELTRGAVSKLLDRLANKGLVVARADDFDGRAQVICLSASGRRLVPKLAALADENDAETFGHLSTEQRAELLALLKSIVEHLGLRGIPVD